MGAESGYGVDADLSVSYAAGMFHGGDVLRKWRKHKRLSVLDVADRANLDKNTITRAEAGQSLNTETLAAIVKALGHSMKDFHGVLDALTASFTDSGEPRDPMPPEHDPIAEMASRATTGQRAAIEQLLRAFVPGSATREPIVRRRP